MTQSVFSVSRMAVAAAAIAGVAAAGYLAYRAQAATDTGSVTLTGTVGAVVSITVTPTAGYDTLDITTQQTVTDQQVATVSETSNIGYTVSVESSNLTSANCTTTTSPCLYSSAGGGTDIQTDLKINAVSINFDSNPKQYKTGTVALTGTTPEAVAITYTIAQAYPAGAYAETLTFTITST